MSNTICLPSGETSSVIQVPSSVVKVILRLGAMGSFSGFFSFSSLSSFWARSWGFAAAWAWRFSAGRTANRIAAAARQNIRRWGIADFILCSLMLCGWLRSDGWTLGRLGILPFRGEILSQKWDGFWRDSLMAVVFCARKIRLKWQM